MSNTYCRNQPNQVSHLLKKGFRNHISEDILSWQNHLSVNLLHLIQGGLLCQEPNPRAVSLPRKKQGLQGMEKQLMKRLCHITWIMFDPDSLSLYLQLTAI